MSAPATKALAPLPVMMSTRTAFISLGFVQCLVQLGDGGAVQRVELVRAVDGDGADAVRISDQEVGRTWASVRFLIMIDQSCDRSRWANVSATSATG
jgi:hypothetical protein